MSYAFLDISVGKAASNRIIIELFDTLAPKTCTLFKSLLSSTPGYKSTHFHRIIEDFMIQGGSVSNETSMNCPAELENRDYPVDKPGLVGMARTNAAEMNAQFFITLVEAGHLTGQHTIFGKVVKGMEVVGSIGSVEVDEEDRPVVGRECVIVNCGELQQRQKKEEKSVSPERARKHVDERERSVSPRRERETSRRRSRSPREDKEERRRRSGSRDGERRHRHHHRHRRHHHRSENGEDREPENGKDKSRPEHSERRHSRHDDREVDDTRRDSIPTGPRGHQQRKQYRPESNFGRLGYDAGYDGWRDDEGRLRDIERQRDSERGREEPEVIFKGRGAMKFRERRSFGSNRY